MRTLIADQNQSFRSEFVGLITHCHANWQITEIDSAAELCSRMRASRFDVVFVDLQLPGLGAEFDLRSLHEEYPGTKFVGLGDTNDTVTMIRCFEEGFGGYIGRSSSGMRLITTLKVIGSPELFVSTAMAPRSRSQPDLPLAPPMALGAALPVAVPVARQREMDLPAHPLTARQADVLSLLAEGRSTKDIARRLGLAVPTVKTHLAAVYRQLGARNRLQAVVKASAMASAPHVAANSMPRAPAPSPMFERHFAAG